jgi:hypothetical protein
VRIIHCWSSFADDLDQHLLRDDIEHTEPTETPAVPLSPRPGVMHLKAGTARRSAR